MARREIGVGHYWQVSRRCFGMALEDDVMRRASSRKDRSQNSAISSPLRVRRATSAAATMERPGMKVIAAAMQAGYQTSAAIAACSSSTTTRLVVLVRLLRR